MNRYVMVFTVVTIIFLPLGFVAVGDHLVLDKALSCDLHPTFEIYRSQIHIQAYFSMPLAQDPDPAVLSSKFTMTIIVGPLLTYFCAAALVIVVDHNGFSETFKKGISQKVFPFWEKAAVAARKKPGWGKGQADQDEVTMTGANQEPGNTKSIRYRLGGILKGRRKRRANSESGETGVEME
jgi:hypothetical protein